MVHERGHIIGRDHYSGLDYGRMELSNHRRVIFHLDRGIQYNCNEFTEILKASKLVTQSLSRKGICVDNAVVESIKKVIKVEWVSGRKYNNQQQAQLSIFEWIESYYNGNRKHSALGYQTIEE